MIKLVNEDRVKKYPTKSDITSKLSAALGRSFVNRCIIEKYGKLDSVGDNKYDKDKLFILVPTKDSYTYVPTGYLKEFNIHALSISEEDRFCKGLYREYSIYEVIGWK